MTLTSAGAAATASVAGSPYADRRRVTRVGTGLGNYDITYVDGALTVEAKALTITANDQTKTYGDTSPSRAPSSAPSAWSTATRSTA